MNANKKREKDRHVPGSGLRGAPKKGGYARRGGWGRAGDPRSGEVISDDALDHRDPNYSDDEETPVSGAPPPMMTVVEIAPLAVADEDVPAADSVEAPVYADAIPAAVSSTTSQGIWKSSKALARERQQQHQPPSAAAFASASTAAPPPSSSSRPSSHPNTFVRGGQGMGGASTGASGTSSSSNSATKQRSARFASNVVLVHVENCAELVEYPSKWGEEALAAVRVAGLEVKSAYFQELQLFGFMVFASDAKADAARTALDGLIVGSSRDPAQLRAERCSHLCPGKDPRLRFMEVDPYTIVLKNLPFHISSEELLSMIGRAYSLTPQSVTLNTDPAGVFRGIAFLHYRNEMEVHGMLDELEPGMIVDNRTVRVEDRRLRGMDLPQIEAELRAFKRDRACHKYYFPSCLNARQVHDVVALLNRIGSFAVEVTNDGDVRQLVVTKPSAPQEPEPAVAEPEPEEAPASNVRAAPKVPDGSLGFSKAYQELRASLC